jgi:predicted small metal-binding protein
VESRLGTRTKQITCECGFIARGETNDEVIVHIREHLAADHPAMLDEVSREELLGWVEEI